MESRVTFELLQAARAKIEQIDAIWEKLEVQALDEMNPQPLRSQLSTITRILSRNGSTPPSVE